MKSLEKHIIRIILGIGLALGLYRLRYFVGSDIPLGYDPGIYKAIFASYSKFLSYRDRSQFPQWIRHEPLLGILAAFLNKLGVSFDRMLTRGIGLINLLPGFLLFRYFKSKDKRVGTISAVLYRSSIVGYDVFRRNYFKQIVGVNLMLLILILGEKKKMLMQSLMFGLLIILHKHTALYTGALLGLSTIVECVQKKHIPWKKIGYRAGAGIIALLFYIPMRSRIMPEAMKALGSTFAGDGTGGDFMTKFEYMRYARPVIILSLVGLWKKVQQKKWDTLFIGYLVGVLRIGFRFVNYNRTIVFLDVFLVSLAAYGLTILIHSRKRYGLILTCLVCLFTAGKYVQHVHAIAHPLISQEEFSSIQSLDSKIELNAMVMNTHRNYSPWIMGWSEREYINPGMADSNKRSHEEWNHRRSIGGADKCMMLRSSYALLKKPMYMRVGNQQYPEIIDGGNCFQTVEQGTTWKLYKILF